MLWLSLGENCLSDDILKRHGLKSFSTPFSHGRTNIDYVLQLEDISCEMFLKDENIAHEYIGETKVARSKLLDCSNIFEQSVSNGFEFTHHDVKSSEEARDSYKRKIDRLKSIKGNDDVVFLYHHRFHNNKNLIELFSKLDKLSRSYESKGKRCSIICFTQTRTESKQDRRIEATILNSRVVFFNFFTDLIWCGTNPNVLWARNDDDLILEMLEFSKSLFCSRA